MDITRFLKRKAIAAVTALSQAGTPAYDVGNDEGHLDEAIEWVTDKIADWGVDKSVERQLAGIYGMINQGLVDLGPYAARQLLARLPQGIIEQGADCSIYDVKPGDDAIQHSGALVFVELFADDFGVVRNPIVELVGFGASIESAWATSQKLPRLSPVGPGTLQKEKSYMLWYQYKLGKIEAAKIPYPFYLAVLRNP